MSTGHGVPTEIFTIIFFKHWKNGKSAGIIFGRLYTCNIYIVTISASEFTQLYICCNWSNLIQLKNLSDLQEFRIRHRHLSILVKYSYIANSEGVLFHWKLNFSLKIFIYVSYSEQYQLWEMHHSSYNFFSINTNACTQKSWKRTCPGFELIAPLYLCPATLLKKKFLKPFVYSVEKCSNIL